MSNLSDTTEGQTNIEVSDSILSEKASESSTAFFAEEEHSPEVNIVIISFFDVLLLISLSIIVFCSGRMYGSSTSFIPSSLNVIS